MEFHPHGCHCGKITDNSAGRQRHLDELNFIATQSWEARPAMVKVAFFRKNQWTIKHRTQNPFSTEENSGQNLRPWKSGAGGGVHHPHFGLPRSFPASFSSKKMEENSGKVWGNRHWESMPIPRGFLKDPGRKGEGGVLQSDAPLPRVGDPGGGSASCPNGAHPAENAESSSVGILQQTLT